MAELRYRLNELIDIFNISEIELSKSTKLAQATLNNIRKGLSEDPKLSTLKPLAQYFNVTIGQLIGLEPLPANLSSQNILEKKGFLEIPVISWDQLDDYEKIVPSLNHNNWSDWTYTDESIVSPLAFALEIKHPGLEPTFPKFTKIIIEPREEKSCGNYILCSIKNKKTVQICELKSNGNETQIQPINAYPTAISEDNYNIIGVILGTQVTFKTKIVRDN